MYSFTARLPIVLLLVLLTPAVWAEVEILTATVISDRPHNSACYTQGLEFNGAELYESCGLYGQSKLTEIDPATGEVLRFVELPPTEFAEGITHVGDDILVLTWKEHKAHVFDRDSFTWQKSFDYTGQGWGLCYDGEQLIMSDGSSLLTFRDPDTFDIVSSVTVTLNGNPQNRINELEYVEGFIWANVYQTNNIVKIDPATGEILAIVEAADLLTPEEQEGVDVLNGIAYNPVTETFLITGKLWPKTFEVIFIAKSTSIGQTWSSRGTK